MENIYFIDTLFMLICNGFVVLSNKYVYLHLFFSNTVNIKRYSAYKQMLFAYLIIFKRVKVPETKKFESHWPRQIVRCHQRMRTPEEGEGGSLGANCFSDSLAHSNISIHGCRINGS